MLKSSKTCGFFAGENHLHAVHEFCGHPLHINHSGGHLHVPLQNVQPQAAQVSQLHILKYFQLHIPPMDALLFPGRLRPGKRSASIGRRLFICLRLKCLLSTWKYFVAARLYCKSY